MNATSAAPLVLVPGLGCTPRLYAEQMTALWKYGPVQVADHRRADSMDQIARQILAEAPKHLSEDGFLICEVGESERALVELLPQLPFNWIEFKVGQMGIFQIEREDLLTWHIEIEALAAERRGG